METVFHNVRDLSADERSVAERLVGHSLAEEQKIVIQVVDSPEVSGEESPLPPWFNVYEGLTEEQIDTLEKAISRRLNLSRTVK